MSLYRPKPRKGYQSPYWYFDFWLDGKRYTGSTEKTKKADARDVEAGKRQEIRDGKQPATITPIKFSELTKKYRETHAKGTKSEGFYNVTLNVLERYFNDPLVTDISREDCDAFWNDRKASKKLSTARTSLIVLKHLFSKAADWKHIRRDAIPTNGMALPKVKLGKARIPTKDETEAILKAADDWFKPYLILNMHGTRRSEGRKLDWPQVDFKAKSITLLDTKSNEDRVIDMTPPLEAALRVLASRVQGGAVFLRDGHRITINDIRSAWARACRKAGVVALRLHDLRHGYATAMLDSGVPPQTICNLAGWKDVSMLRRYGHDTPEGRARAAVAMAQVLTPSPVKVPQQPGSESPVSDNLKAG